MKTVTLDLRTPREVSADFVRAWKTRKTDRNARISFGSPALLWKVLTAKRWELIKAMTGQGPITLRSPVGAVTAAQVEVSPPTVDSRVLENPAEGYTREVKAALIDAMIEHSGPLNLGPEEWLTVAARDNVPRDPLIPGDATDFSTIIFRMKEIGRAHV